MAGRGKREGRLFVCGWERLWLMGLGDCLGIREQTIIMFLCLLLLAAKRLWERELFYLLGSRCWKVFTLFAICFSCCWLQVAITGSGLSHSPPCFVLLICRSLSLVHPLSKQVTSWFGLDKGAGAFTTLLCVAVENVARHKPVPTPSGRVLFSEFFRMLGRESACDCVCFEGWIDISSYLN